MHPTASPQTLQEAAEHLKKADAILAPIIEWGPAPHIEPHKNYYQELVDSIISQQLSVKAAATIMKRFVDSFEGDGFPTPEQILTKDIEELRAIGLSRQKATYIQDLAAKVLDGSVQFDHLDALSNDAIIDELTRIKGVGVWTAHMFLLFCMGRLDILPTGDLGIRNGIQKLYRLKAAPTPEVIEDIARRYGWHPYESVASWYVWKSLDNEPAL